jgi:hypothetical protein
MIEVIIEAGRIVTEDQEALIGQGDQGGAAVMIEIADGAEKVEVQGDPQGTAGATALAIQKMPPPLLVGTERGNANQVQVVMTPMRKEGKTGAAVVAFHLKIEARKQTGVNGKGAKAIAVLGAKVEIEILDLAKGVTKEAEGARKDQRDAVGV